MTNHKVAAMKDRTGADETHSRENAQRQAQNIGDRERVGGFAIRRKEQIRLDHRHRGGETHQQRRPQSCRPPLLAAIRPDQSAGDHGEEQPQRNIRP